MPDQTKIKEKMKENRLILKEADNITLKVIAAKRSITLRQLLQEIIQDYIRKNSKP